MLISNFLCDGDSSKKVKEDTQGGVSTTEPSRNVGFWVFKTYDPVERDALQIHCHREICSEKFCSNCPEVPFNFGKMCEEISSEIGSLARVRSTTKAPMTISRGFRQSYKIESGKRR
jgi:hypothetical protein